VIGIRIPLPDRLAYPEHKFNSSVFDQFNPWEGLLFFHPHLHPETYLLHPFPSLSLHCSLHNYRVNLPIEGVKHTWKCSTYRLFVSHRNPPLRKTLREPRRSNGPYHNRKSTALEMRCSHNYLHVAAGQRSSVKRPRSGKMTRTDHGISRINERVIITMGYPE